MHLKSKIYFTKIKFETFIALHMLWTAKNKNCAKYVIEGSDILLKYFAHEKALFGCTAYFVE